jgi:hypothetical protein
MINGLPVTPSWSFITVVTPGCFVLGTGTFLPVDRCSVRGG